MFDFIIRALLHPFDYGALFQKHILVLQEIKRESDDIYSFAFKPEFLCTWKAGQHGVFSFPHTKITGKTWRAFSVASSPEEGVIRIATIIKENPSDFKKHLLALEQGDTLIMNGPFGEFHTNKGIKQIVGIAGGIGITPFRALIQSIASGTIPNTNITLIYSAVGAHTFKKEFEQWAHNEAIEIIYTTTPEEVNTALDSQIALHKNSATYFVSGSPGMISAIRTLLKTKGIRKIVSDPFKGY
jgi:ferredoxin-NADP reductase